MTTASNDIFYILFDFTSTKSLDISCESSAKQSSLLQISHGTLRVNKNCGASLQDTEKAFIHNTCMAGL